MILGKVEHLLKRGAILSLKYAQCVSISRFHRLYFRKVLLMQDHLEVLLEDRIFFFIFFSNFLIDLFVYLFQQFLHMSLLIGKYRSSLKYLLKVQ